MALRPTLLVVVAAAACGRRGSPTSDLVRPDVQAPASVSAARSAPAPSESEGRALSEPVPPAQRPKAILPPMPADSPFFWPAGYTPPRRWETKTVNVDGVSERWSLEWDEPPRFNGCPFMSWCGCEGVDFGLEGGTLVLVRERPGEPVERLDLSDATSRLPPIPYTDQESGFPEIPGFVATKNIPDNGFMNAIVALPHADAMVMNDYDHDGRATEFVLKIGYIACGQNPSVVVGISRSNPHLHVFSSVESPGVPLVMTYLSEWDAIANAKGPIDVALHSCGDHGGGGIYVNLSFAKDGIHVGPSGADCDWSVSPPAVRNLER